MQVRVLPTALQRVTHDLLTRPNPMNIPPNFPHPAYLIEPLLGGATVKKIEQDGAQQEYIVVFGECDCPGFEHRGHCKHVKMTEGTYEGEGVDRAVALFEVAQVTKCEGPPNNSFDNIPDIVKKIVLDSGKRPKRTLCGLKKFPDGGSLVIYLSI